jgi:hypothetical protein
MTRSKGVSRSAEPDAVHDLAIAHGLVYVAVSGDFKAEADGFCR